MRQLCHWSIFTPVTSDKGPVTILQLHAPLPQHPFDGIGEAGGIQIHPETGIGPDDFFGVGHVEVYGVLAVEGGENAPQLLLDRLGVLPRPDVEMDFFGCFLEEIGRAHV